MRLDFNILWVDDQPNNVQPTREALERLLRKQGFRLVVQFVTSVDGAAAFIADDIQGDHIDLILMDYKLGAGGNGVEGIKIVRQSLPYKEIVFYSAQTLLDELKQTSAGGVYLALRDDLKDVAYGVFETLVKKVLDIDHCRGIVVGAASDIDHYVFESIFALFDSSDGKTQAETLSAIKERLREIEARWVDGIRELDAIKHPRELVEKHHIYTSADRANLLKKLLKWRAIHADKLDAIGSFVSKTMPRRNDLAHLRVKIEGLNRKLFDRRNVEFTVAEMRDLRIRLLEAQEVFEAIHTSLVKVTEAASGTNGASRQTSLLPEAERR